MKSLLMGLVIVGTFAQPAETEVLVGVSPGEPTIILADLVVDPGTEDEKLVKAPWFFAEFLVANSDAQSVLVSDILMRVESVEHQVSYHYALAGVEVPSGQQYGFGEYLSNLPSSSNTRYQVEATFYYTHPGGPYEDLRKTIQFETR